MCVCVCVFFSPSPIFFFYLNETTFIKSTIVVPMELRIGLALLLFFHVIVWIALIHSIDHIFSHFVKTTLMILDRRLLHRQFIWTYLFLFVTMISNQALSRIKCHFLINIYSDAHRILSDPFVRRNKKHEHIFFGVYLLSVLLITVMQTLWLWLLEICGVSKWVFFCHWIWICCYFDQIICKPNVWCLAFYSNEDFPIQMWIASLFLNDFFK